MPSGPVEAIIRFGYSGTLDIISLAQEMNYNRISLDPKIIGSKEGKNNTGMVTC